MSYITHIDIDLAQILQATLICCSIQDLVYFVVVYVLICLFIIRLALLMC